MQIIKRDDSTLELNINKLVEAIRKMITELVERIAEIADRTMSQMHEVAHVIMHFFSGIFGRVPKKVSLVSMVYVVPLLVPDLKHITINFLEHASEVRKQYLLTRYHRGNADDADFSFSCNLITVI